MSKRDNTICPPLTRRRLVQIAGAATGVGAVAGLRAGMRSGRAAQNTAGELVIGAPGDRHSMEPPLSNIGMSIPNANIYETLVNLSPTFQPEPGLAESWEFIEPNTWRFTLRQGVTFHDGTPFTAEAVKWTMARVAESGGSVMSIGPDSVAIVDDHTVEITPTRPNRRLPLQLSAPRTGSILAPNSDNLEARIGTGPFREVEYVPQERHVVEAFPEYWGGPAKLSRLTFRYLPDPTTRLLALEAGEVDAIYDVPRESAAEVEGSYALVTSEIGAYQSISVNIHGSAPYDLGQDPTIRAALAHAIDKEAIASASWFGYAETNTTMVPEAILGDAAAIVTGTPFDQDRARQLLEDAGWAEGSDGIREKDGRALGLEMVVGYPSAEIHGTMPEFVQAQLREVGIDLSLVLTPDAGTYGARLTAREGDLWAEVGNQTDADPCYLPGLLFYSPNPDVDDEANQYGNAFAPGAAFDAVIDGCGEVATTPEIQAAAAEAMKIMIDDEHIVFPIAGIRRLYGLTTEVEGFVAHPVQFVQRWDAVSVKAN